MSNLSSFKSELHSLPGGRVFVRLLMVEFTDENNVHFLHSPHLDLTGCGHDKREAKESFKIALDDFLSYTINKKTLRMVLEELGWKMKPKAKLHKAVVPNFMEIAKKNPYMNEVFSKYSTHTYHEEVGMPVGA